LSYGLSAKVKAVCARRIVARGYSGPQGADTLKTVEEAACEVLAQFGKMKPGDPLSVSMRELSEEPKVLQLVLGIMDLPSVPLSGKLLQALCIGVFIGLEIERALPIGTRSHPPEGRCEHDSKT
jgi:hypothetical protein